ncbi:16S rRNA (guanine(527)-N(7))-methyltransferase RsmG [Bullifex porci]|uniref:16S rRNA (guanine(527)-N(7))-methyltransferase RsmG n=1 Tax=Bullifex porci TaxID=2606638 RepID=UPI0023F090CB|nr:16S rRNA (guanine(527)-N(7))-methyltransferase RsmG [Bullifex porci]MDD7255877.1 16S rRNA (guanine(527)-N(7))-methyltransferase RsmG [Bullifex porci]MDD7588672.1 16S rRNA (guanine(527)-N(7))-methyltransferase RsmG [Bullifex porci]MDY2742177.1 16S rRNA (guanine(527)-N(7))-methyltransferase RsmG [Bullifex porci]
MDLLLEGAEKLKLDLTSLQRERLERYISEIELFNPIYKLVSYQDRDELIIRHILDSLAGVKVFEALEGSSIADLGTGAGFPGVVLAIMLDRPIVLVERMKRRVDFLKNVILRCNLKNVRIVSKDVSEVEERFDIVTCRAFHPIFDIIDDVDRILSPNGVFAPYKGKKSYLYSEIENLSNWDVSITNLHVPFLDEERIIALMRKKN